MKKLTEDIVNSRSTSYKMVTMEDVENGVLIGTEFEDGYEQYIGYRGIYDLSLFICKNCGTVRLFLPYNIKTNFCFNCNYKAKINYLKNKRNGHLESIKILDEEILKLENK